MPRGARRFSLFSGGWSTAFCDFNLSTLFRKVSCKQRSGRSNLRRSVESSWNSSHLRIANCLARCSRSSRPLQRPTKRFHPHRDPGTRKPRSHSLGSERHASGLGRRCCNSRNAGPRRILGPVRKVCTPCCPILRHSKRTKLRPQSRASSLPQGQIPAFRPVCL